MRVLSRRVARRRIDVDLVRLGRPTSRPAEGWVRAIREALGMSELELSARMGVTQQRVSQLQRAEVGGTIQLSTLARAARALNCELVYFLAPTEPLGDMVWRQAFVKAAEEVGYDPDDPDDDAEAVLRGEQAEALAPSWVDRRGLWQQAPGAGQPPANAGPVSPVPSVELPPGFP